MPAEPTSPCSAGSIREDAETDPAWSALSLSDFEPARFPEPDGAASGRAGSSYWKDVWGRLKSNCAAMLALGALALMAVFAFAGPCLIPYAYDQTSKTAGNLCYYHYSLADQDRISLAAALARAEGRTDVTQRQIARELGIRARPFGYSAEELGRIAAGEKVFPHVLGTDALGRDFLVRIMVGTRLSMVVGVCAALIILLIGAVYGAVSGYFGGRVDAVMTGFVELIYSVPEILVVLLLVTVLKPAMDDWLICRPETATAKLIAAVGPSLVSIFIAFGLMYWATMSRIIRGQVLRLKQQDYITAARALGATHGRIIVRHLLPNCVGQLVVTACLQIPSAIFLESFLSFLGLGVAAPLTSLGSMASDALSGIYTYTYRLIVPAVILTGMILCFNVLGDGLRDALDPRLKNSGADGHGA